MVLLHLNNLFLVVEISLAVLVNYNVAHMMNHASDGSYLKGVMIRRSLSVYTILLITSYPYSIHMAFIHKRKY